jgi:ubiquinone/menaquinone biosynthesis C-methylase UbiE
MEGLPCFVDERKYWGDIPEENMRKLNARVEKVGWKSALEEAVEKETPGIFEYVVSEHRAKFKYLFSNLENAVILDIGSGWGSIAMDLARECKEVTTVENVTERAIFIKQRAIQEGIENLKIVIADAAELPLPEGYYDYVILNGLLEWIGLYVADKDPKVVQIEFLTKIRRLLNPAGKLYIGIENRIGAAAWRGAADHSGLSYTSLMPRKVANYYCKLRRRNAYGTYEFVGGYRTYTYSWIGYRRILEAAGYKSVSFFEEYPGYKKPCIIIPLEGPHQSRYFYKYIFTPDSLGGKIRRTLMKILLIIGMQTTFPSCFGMLANGLS